MKVDYLEELSTAVEFLLGQPATQETIRALKTENRRTPGPFVWSVLDLDSLPGKLPPAIKSGWIFVLKQDTPSECHYHPNSIQHMAMIEGQGQSKIGAVWQELVQFGAPGKTPAEQWCVIDQGVPHEFFPCKTEMVVVSFHTCRATELEEIAYETGEKRRYQPET